MNEMLLLGPGPSNCPPSVLQALAQPTLGHLDPQFLELMEGLQEDLRSLFRTRNALTIAVSGTGTCGMEALLTNLIESGDRVVVCVNGVFGGRAAELLRRLGARVESVEELWGRPVDPEPVAVALAAERTKALFFVHAETSTGALSDAKALAALAHEHGALAIADCVTSLGGVPVLVDEWELDAVFSGTQKCLSVPPGLAPITLGPAALDALDERRSPPPSWYLDLDLVRHYWGPQRTYHHTAPVNMLYGLAAGLRLVREEGLEPRWARHQAAHDRLVSGLAELGLEILPPPGARLPMLNAVIIPDDVNEVDVRIGLRDRHRIEIGAGLGDLKGRVWRVGLMGENARPEVVDRFLAALAEELGR